MRNIFFLTVLILFSQSVEAKFVGKVSNEQTIKNEYYISCTAKKDDVRAYLTPNIKDEYKGLGGKELVTFRKGTDLGSVTIVESKGRQFLYGRIVYYRQGGDVISWEKPAEYVTSEEDSDKLYALPEEWDCSLYWGGN